MFAAKGLTRISEDNLRRLLQAVHRGTLQTPITRGCLIAHAFGHIEGGLDLLVGLDEAGARAVLVAVLAERKQA